MSTARPTGVRSKVVLHNNLSLLLHCGNPNETLLPFLGKYLPEADRVSEYEGRQARYLWQDTIELLAEAKMITLDTLTKAWVLVATPNKPDIPDSIKKLFREVKKVDYDKFLDDVDTDTLTPIEAKRTSTEEVLADLDMEHDTYDTFSAVFKDWPYMMTFDHKLYGKILVLGQLSGKNKNEHLVYKGCKLNDDSFGKIGAIAEYERKGARDSTYKIKVLRLKPAVLKFWINIDDPSRPKGHRDLEEMYRYFDVTATGIREIDSLAYQAVKNQFTLEQRERDQFVQLQTPV